MARGDHIVVPICGPMTHHGIDLGDGTVVHWSSGMPGYASFTDIITRKFAAEIRRTPFADFGDPANVHVRDYGTSFEADEVIRRALSRVGEKGYCLVGNNCEHLATWCKIGKHQSEQVKQVNGVSASVLRLGRTGVGGVRILSRLGGVPGLRKRGVIAGLGTLGRIVGGGPATGLVLATCTPAVVSAVTVHAILGDDDTLSNTERDARAAGRTASVGGAVLGTAASVGVVAAAGVPGLSAVGISTGLAAIGGGSVALGLAAALALPAVVTLGAGFLAYRLKRGTEPARVQPCGC